MSANRPTTNDPASNPMIKWAIAGGIALLILIIAYYAGVSSGRGQLEAQKKTHEQQLAQAKAETSQIRAELERQKTLNQLMTARGWLYRASSEIDRRNFGLANENVKKAGDALNAVNPAVINLDANALNALKQSVTETDVNIAQNFETQRAQILTLTRDLDALIPQS